MKVDRELQEAVQKHGEVDIPEQYEDQFASKIENAKRKLVTQA